jgi:hypothetical protein
MTPTYNDFIANPISRITIGGLQDLGYTVDYTKAEAYTGYDLDACPCARRLGDTTIARQLEFSEAQKAALEFGKNILRSTQNDLIADGVGDGFQSVVGEWVSVAYGDGTGRFHSLIVRKKDLET